MYQSGQFIIYKALPEDWYSEDKLFGDLAKIYPSGEVLTLYTSLIHPITDAVAFAGRLGEKDLYKEGVKISLTLHGTRGRKLNIEDGSGVPFSRDRYTAASKLTVSGSYSIEEVIEDNLLISNQFIMKVISSFDYNPLPEMILDKQRLYVSGRG